MTSEFGFAVSDAQAHDTFAAAFAHGLRMIDTAPFYGDGLAEKRVGELLRTVPRVDVIVGTKVGWLPATRSRDYSRDGVLRSVEGSLARLQTDYLDIAHVHDPDEGDFYQQVLDEAIPALHELKSQGVIRAIGSGMNQWEMLGHFARNADVDCFLLAGRYSLLEQTPLREFFPLMLEKKIAIFLGGVYNSGILATGAIPGARFQYAPASEEILTKTRRIEAVCARHGVPLRAAALQFAAAPAAVTTVVLGMVSPAEVDDNLALLALPIPTDLWNELRAEGLIDPAAPAGA